MRGEAGRRRERERLRVEGSGAVGSDARRYVQKNGEEVAFVGWKERCDSGEDEGARRRWETLAGERTVTGDER